MTVKVENLNLYYPAMNIAAENLSGTIHPTVNLSSSTLSIQRANETTSISGTFPHPLEGEDVSLSVTMDEYETNFSVSIPSFPYKHPLLSQTTIRFPKSTIKGLLNGSRLTTSIQAHDSNISLHGTVDIHAQVAQIDYEGSIPLHTLHHIFPLSQELSLSGSFLFKGALQWPSQTWSIQLDSDDLSVSGNLFDPLPFKYGPFQHSSPSTGKSYISGPQVHTWTPYKDLGWMAKTAVAAEDSAYWSHNGYSTKSMEEALLDYQRKNTLRGGSTITQQLAKNLFLSAEKTIERKVHELIYALALEKSLTKEELLTLYLNIVEFGPEIHGIYKASQLYFLKKPSSLSLVEASYLASILPAPTRFFTIAQKSKRIPRGKTNRVLKNLLNARVISKNEYEKAFRTNLVVLPPTE